MAALSVMLAAVGALCGAIEREAVDPALYGEKSRAAVAQTHGMRDDDAVTAYIGMDAARQHDAAQTIALYMALGGEDAPLAVDELSEKEISHMSDVRRLIALCRTMRTGCISLAAGLAVAMAWVGAELEKRHRPVMIGAVCGALVPAAAAGVVGGMMNAGFDSFRGIFCHAEQLDRASHLFCILDISRRDFGNAFGVNIFKCHSGVERCRS